MVYPFWTDFLLYMKMRYTDYSLYDFVFDDSFIRGVKRPESEEAVFWDEWISVHPDKKELINEARQIILLMDFENPEFTERDADRLWHQLNRRIESGSHSPSPARTSALFPLLFFKNFRRVAAVFLGILVLMVPLYLVLESFPTTTYTTGYGETLSILLPDSSSVVLNASSSIQFNSPWRSGQAREVWLQGEAYFTVTHTDKDQKFIVHTGDLGVEVLGTEFNVNRRGEWTKVVLNSGNIKLSLPSVPANIGLKEIFMKPGELVEYSERDKIVTRQEADLDKHIGWSKNKLVFKDTPLREIVQLLEDNYGLGVFMADPATADRTFTATFPANEIEILTGALSRSFDIEIYSVKKP